jgi:hypothetical protein
MRAFSRATIRPCAAALAASALMVVLSMPAFAQEDSGRPTRRTDAQKQEDASVDKAYRAATKGDKSLPSVKVDPWRTVRDDDDKKAKH